MRFVASQGPGSHGTLYAGDRKTTVKDRKKDIGKGLLAKMLDDLGIAGDDIWSARMVGNVPHEGSRISMSHTYDYPAEVERDEDGRYVVAFPDFGWGATDGATREEALAEARDLLRELIAATMREGKGLPEPSRATKRRPLVVPPVPIALKAALYQAFREAGVSQRRLARDLDVAESEVRRMLNPDHATKSAAIDRALRRLGKRVSVTVGEAA